MLTLPPSVRVYVAAEPTDLRKSFDGLSILVTHGLGHDPLSGHLFLFVSRSRDRLKILYWDADGFCIWYKRLEEGTFRLPAKPSASASVELRASELAMLLEGIDLCSVKRRKRFSPVHGGP